MKYLDSATAHNNVHIKAHFKIGGISNIFQNFQDILL